MNLPQPDPTLLVRDREQVRTGRDRDGRDAAKGRVGCRPVAVDGAGGEVHYQFVSIPHVINSARKGVREKGTYPISAHHASTDSP